MSRKKQVIFIGGGAAGAGAVSADSAFATDEAIIRADGTARKTQDSLALIDDSGNITTPGSITAGSGSTDAGGLNLKAGTAVAAGTGEVRIQAPAAVTDYDIVLPGTVGSTGFLKGTVSGTRMTLSLEAATGGLGYALFCGATRQATVSASTTYYLTPHSSATLSVNANRYTYYVPKAGTITAARIGSYASTAGSNEAWAWSIVVNGGSPTQIASVAASTNVRNWINTGLSIAVAVGDLIEITTTTPAFGTPPATCDIWGTLFIE